MNIRRLLAMTLCCGIALPAGWAYYRETTVGDGMAGSAESFLASLDDAQRSRAVVPYADARRVDWHFIPKPERKGLQIKEMSESQRLHAHELLKTALSELGYSKTTQIMELEKLLKELQTGDGPLRDWERYYFTLFGDPSGTERWGLSVEGHHLSLNFVVENGQVLSTTPQAFCTNPAVVKTPNSTGVETGTRILAKEETLGFELVNSLSAEQATVAVIDAKAPAEVRAPGAAHPPTDPPVGITTKDLTESQQQLLRSLIDEYAQAMPAPVAEERWSAIEEAGWENVHFAWAGAREPGIGHYYRIQGPTFVIELVNTQPDVAGNLANHVHCLWRDMRGDFALPIGGE
jgi:hypothetical protein